MSTETITGRSYKPPYISGTVWKAFFDKMRTVNKPAELTVDEIKKFAIASGQEIELQSGLKYLGLLDVKGKTTEKFKSIQLSGEPFKKNLGEIIQAAYADLLKRHPLEHATYETLKNYFSNAHSTASAKKMAKSFAVLCLMADMNSPAFDKMRSLSTADQSGRTVTSKREKTLTSNQPSSNAAPKSHYDDEALVREFIKTNPMPTAGQWDSATLKTFFQEYRETLKMLRGENKEGEE